MKRLWLFMLVGLLCIPGQGFGEERKPFLLIGTGSITGVYYAAGHAVAKVVNRNIAQHPFRVDAMSSAGSLENINRVLNGEWDFGIAQADMLYKASNGLGPWHERPEKSLRAVAVLYTEALTIITNADEGIDSVSDLRGKKVSIGEPGSADHANMLLVFKFYGIDPQQDLTLFEQGPADSADLLKEKVIDAYCYTVGHPNFSLVEAAFGETPIQILGIEPEIIKQTVAKSPYLVEAHIPVGDYQRITNKTDVVTLGVKAILFTRDSEPQANVFTLTDELLGDFPRFQRQHPAFEESKREDLAAATVIPFHPGAEAAFRKEGVKP